MKKLFKLFYKYYLSPRPEVSPVKQDDFEMYVENFNFEKYRKNIFAFQNKFSVEAVKTIEYKNEVFEIFKIETRNKQAKKKLLVFAAVHGNEFATALVIPIFLADISSNPDFYREWQIRIISPINPVGLKCQSRYNKDGYDINRDFKKFETEDSKLQCNEIDVFKPDMLISLHEHPFKGFMFLCNDKVSRLLQKKILNKLKEKNILLCRTPFIVKIPGTKAGVMRIGVLLKVFRFIFGIYTLERYASKKNIENITSESYWNERDIEKRIFPHMLVLRSVVSDYGK
ncbi:MAG: hypothetical protein A2626_00365 [Candidatus Nealsonbacteria bacterium RIFCSPHIGHO2_01_FULL_38_55]|uniref:Succinylglutamate desuccinylase/Aspartoacylase catalytic domain-containing protein n=1 Tax=Candidatus Nealsonbacteria bacterium RIFCSPHIGHO2_01_FULL_38_55 TaxID=1801664 RepID=A0A1G2E564_9BACT|nr:MAG: hypothetical protein A2626_00365 [Candidatus Nealsonbacteria bacterium RIFCSPHIGHO2_01_FULL_38_55]